MKRWLITNLLLMAFLLPLVAQITVKMEVEPAVKVNSQFYIRVFVNALTNAPTLRAPKIIKLKYGPTVSQSSSTQIINGKVSSSVEKSFTYIVVATKEGKYTIPPVEVKHEGKVYKSNAANIEVVKDNAAVQKKQGTKATSSGGDGEPDVFLRMIPSKSTLYEGDHLRVALKLYYKINIVQIPTMKPSSFTYFWSKDIDNADVKPKKENVKGTIYHTFVLRNTILFPLRSGKLTIDPVSLETVVQKAVRNSSFGGFFSSYRNEKLSVNSNSLSINVKERPQAPASFTGAVGKYRLKVTSDKTSLETNEDLTLNIELSGKGNLHLIDAPEVIFPEEFDVESPTPSQSLNTTINGTKGSVSFKYIGIPRQPGDYIIPPVVFTYFDPDQKKYVTHRSDTIHLQITGDPVGTSTQGFRYSQEEVKQLNEDIRFISQDKFNYTLTINSFIGSPAYYSTLFLSLLSSLLFVFYRKKVKQPTRKKNVHAGKIASKYLKQAKKELKQEQKTPFYQATILALQQYLQYKLHLSASEINKQLIYDRLSQKSVPEELQRQLREVIEHCEFAQYAPSSSQQGDMEKVYEQSIKLIGALEKTIKK